MRESGLNCCRSDDGCSGCIRFDLSVKVHDENVEQVKVLQGVELRSPVYDSHVIGKRKFEIRSENTYIEREEPRYRRRVSTLYDDQIF